MHKKAIVWCWVLFAMVSIASFSSADQDHAEPGVAANKTPLTPVVVGYLPSNRLDRHTFDADRLGPVTDLLYFSVEVTERGEVPIDAVDADHAEKFAALKKEAGCRLLLCVGGWGRSEHFPQVAADDVKRQRLIRSLLTICERYGFDGVDYDWEHPKDQAELNDYAALIEDTAELFRLRSLMVTVAQAGWQDLGQRAYDALDRVHLMCYDQPFPQATIQHAEQEVARLIKWGCPKEKIALGMPFYGRNEARQARSYANLVRRLEPGQWDAASDRIDGYAFNGPETIQAKTEFAMNSGLAGVMIWELSHDAPGERSLLSAVQRGLVRSRSNAGE